VTRPSIYRARRTAPFVVDRNTVRLLLLPQPLLSTLYLLGVHARMLEAGYLPLLIMAVFPVATTIIAIAGLRTSSYSRRRNWAVLEISIVELISAALLFATVVLGLSDASPPGP
jgi:hypothetical protein